MDGGIPSNPQHLMRCQEAVDGVRTGLDRYVFMRISGRNEKPVAMATRFGSQPSESRAPVFYHT